MDEELNQAVPERQGSPEFQEQLSLVLDHFVYLKGRKISDVSEIRDELRSINSFIENHNRRYAPGRREFISETLIEEAEITLNGQPFTIELTRDGTEGSFSDRLNLSIKKTMSVGPDSINGIEDIIK